MKKIIAGIGLAIVIPIFLLGIALASLNKIITEEFIVSQLEKSMNLRAEVKKINISIFSAISGITVEGLKLSKRDNNADNAIPLIERKPLESVLISIDNFDFQLNFLAILKGEIQLKKLILKNPIINMVMYETGGNNLSSLFLPPKTVEGKPNDKVETKEEVVIQQSSDEDNRPFSVKDLPLSANLKEIGILSGNINLEVQKTRQKLNIDSLNLVINSIDIAPEDLKNHNSIRADFNFVLKILSIESKDEKAKLIFKSNALVSPFIVETGFINPIINYKLSIIKDSYLEGMVILESITNSIPLLKNAGIEPKGLTEKAVLQNNVESEVQYSNGKIKFLQDSLFITKNYDLELKKDSSVTISTNQHEFYSAIKLSKLESDKSLENLKKIKIDKPESAEIIDSILSKILKDERLYLPFKSSGNLDNPNIVMNLEIPSILDSIKDAILNKAGNELQKQLNKNLPGAGDVIKKLF
jgi:hypothetical protein